MNLYTNEEFKTYSKVKQFILLETAYEKVEQYAEENELDFDDLIEQIDFDDLIEQFNWRADDDIAPNEIWWELIEEEVE